MKTTGSRAGSSKNAKGIVEPDVSRPCATKVMFANDKGGAGKSTLAHHFAEFLASIGLRVLAIDTNSAQANLYRRLNRIRHMPSSTPPTRWADGCDCVLLSERWDVPDDCDDLYDVVIIDTPPDKDLPDGPQADVVVVPVCDLDSALGAGVLSGKLLLDDDVVSPPMIVVVKNGIEEGGKRLYREVSDLEGSDGVEICEVEVPRGNAIHRTSMSCRPAWKDPYKGGDVRAIMAFCEWLARRIGLVVR